MAQNSYSSSHLLSSTQSSGSKQNVNPKRRRESPPPLPSSAEATILYLQQSVRCSNKPSPPTRSPPSSLDVFPDKQFSNPSKNDYRSTQERKTKVHQDQQDQETNTILIKIEGFIKSTSQSRVTYNWYEPRSDEHKIKQAVKTKKKFKKRQQTRDKAALGLSVFFL